MRCSVYVKMDMRFIKRMLSYRKKHSPNREILASFEAVLDSLMILRSFSYTSEVSADGPTLTTEGRGTMDSLGYWGSTTTAKVGHIWHVLCVSWVTEFVHKRVWQCPVFDRSQRSQVQADESQASHWILLGATSTRDRHWRSLSTDLEQGAVLRYLQWLSVQLCTLRLACAGRRYTRQRLNWNHHKWIETTVGATILHSIGTMCEYGHANVCYKGVRYDDAVLVFGMCYGHHHRAIGPVVTDSSARRERKS